MPNRPPRHRPTRPVNRPREHRDSACKRGYDRRWRDAAAGHLHENPLCVRCLAVGVTTAATVVDHVTPHKGASGLFWDRDNWQGLCKPCHDHKTAIEDGGLGRPTTNATIPHKGVGRHGSPAPTAGR